MCGRGTLTWSDGSVYEGDFKNGKRHGLGVLRASDKFSYDGYWISNAMEGRGTATYPNGQTYNGLFVNGKREGRGTLQFVNGAIYEGRFRDDALEGQGTLKIPRTMTVPRAKKEDSVGQLEKSSNPANEKENAVEDSIGEKKESEDKDEDLKPDYMIPLSFQSDMGYIHQKAGFTVGGE